MPADGFCRDKLQFRHTDAGGAKGLLHSPQKERPK
jgi:hypothetical protein